MALSPALTRFKVDYNTMNPLLAHPWDTESLYVIKGTVARSMKTGIAPEAPGIPSLSAMLSKTDKRLCFRRVLHLGGAAFDYVNVTTFLCSTNAILLCMKCD